MPYAALQDLIDRFGSAELIELTDRADPPLRQIDAAVVAAALADADEIVNSYVGRRYDLPLAAVPAALKRVAADIARHLLHKDAPTDSVKAAHEQAMRFLRDVADGKAVLDAGGAEPAGAQSGAPQSSAPERIFTGDTLRDFTT